MKKIYDIFGCLSALIALMSGLCSCVDELDNMKDHSRPSDVICFTASLMNSHGATKSSSGCLSIEQEEWLVGTKKQSVTRGMPVSLLEGEAGVFGYVYEETEGTPREDLKNKLFRFDGDELKAVSEDVRWKTIADAADNSHLSLYVYAPYSSNTNLWNTNGIPQLTYTVDQTVTNQQDLIVASWHGIEGTNYGSGVTTQSIPLTFGHALTGVKFNVGFDCTVTKLEVRGIYNKGTYTFGKGWSVDTTLTPVNYTFDFDGGKTCTANDAVLTTAANTLMMIPDTLSNSAEVVLFYSINGGENDSIKAPLGGKVWQEGKMITYTLHKGVAPSYIYFDLAAGTVHVQPATQNNKDTYSDYLQGVKVGDIIYIGSIYVNGTSKRYAGLHNENNHYYVYQSSEANPERNTKKLTGYASSEDFANRINCRIPSYDPVKYNGQLWSDYITNNTAVEEVINAWDNAAGAGQATSSSATANNPNQAGAAGAVRNVGRQATKNRIHIKGNVGKVNLSIDNIYSSYQERGSTPVRSRTEGGISFIPSWTKGNSVLTINIIGDNRLGCVNYQNTNSNINCLVFEGTGSLTVGDVDYFRDGSGLGSNRSCSVIGGADTPTENEDVFNIKINSGVIYAGATPSTCTAIGGGGNGDTNITINGGTITAVTNSSGAAIGGGTGQIQPGGIGNVTINGGNVYAYNFRPKNTTIPAAAIGGGGSTEKKGNSGNVTINGGYVYAYSRCGTAIGGGSSQDMQGGSANIKINGGQVIAKSDDGTGIGGGTGSAKNNNHNGGNATVTINGNPIIRTGSIGGGGKGPQSTGTIGAANITLEENCEADIQAQFVLAAGIADDASNSFVMKGGTIRNSYVDDEEYLHIQKRGGAVYLEDGSFTMTGGTIKNCSAVQGGAVYIERKSTNPMGADDFNFEMTGGTISSCFATGGTIGSKTYLGHGGAVCLNGGQVQMTGGTITNNYSENGNGGAVYISNGNFFMKEGSPSISGNSAQKGNGGGVFVASEGNEVQVSLLKGLIQNNTANNYGGGVCVDMNTTQNPATVIVGEVGQGDTHPAISGNMSLLSGGGLYVRGSQADVIINSGTIDGNTVAAYVKNENVANEGGEVTLNGGNVTHIVVTFDGNSGKTSGGETSYTQKIVTNTNSKLTENRFSRAGYRFIGWNTRTDGRGLNYTDNQLMNISENITLYATWQVQ